MTTPPAGAAADPGRHRFRFRVLAVCTANLCRSPAVEALLRAALGPDAEDWDIVSAGTRAVTGRPPHTDTAAVLAERGLALPADWTSRQLTADDVEAADLVLTATREHRGATVALRPSAASRVFTLRQFTRLLDAAGPPGTAGPSGPAGSAGPVHPGQVLLRTAQAGRGMGAPPADPGVDDLPDPIGRPRAAFERMVGEVAADVARIVAVVRTAG